MTKQERLETTDIAAMRAWCEDVFSDMPADATDDEVIRCVRCNYEDGIRGFLVDSELV